MTEIYYIEDDQAIAGAVAAYLEQKGFRVTLFSSLADAKTALKNRAPSLVLLDWNMPDGKGDGFCGWLRLRWSRLTVIFLTVRSDPKDVVSGFRQGADDYVVKPFDLEVLYSRVIAVLRRSGQSGDTCLFCGDLVLDKDKTAVFCGQEEIPLSYPEYRLLLILMENKGRTVTKSQLLEQVWDSNGNYVNDNTLTVAMKRLREKLRRPSCLKTIRSFGYRLEEDL